MGDQPHTPPNGQPPNPQPDKDIIGLEEDSDTAPTSHAIPAHHTPTHAPRREPSRQAENARATSALAASHAAKHGATNQNHRGCSSCGYDLFGLPIGKPCPECGAPPPSTAGGLVRDSLMSATDSYLRRLRLGGLLMATAIVLNAILIGAPLVSAVVSAGGPLTAVFYAIKGTGFSSGPSDAVVAAGVLTRLVAFACWGLGAWMVCVRRTQVATSAKDPINETYATIARWSQWTFLAAMLLDFVHLSVVSWISAALSMVGLLGIFSLGLVVGQIAEWAQDSGLGYKLRLTSFGIGGCLLVFILSMLLIPVSPPEVIGFLALIGSACLLGFFSSVFVFAWSMLQFAKMATWAVQNKDVRNERDRQLRERAERERRSHEASKSLKNDPLTISKDAPCTNCGYNLIGLRRTARCPECGNDISE
ncbi:MAG: hypothetical protein IPK69_01695 [Phycisphaerales bacterium]|nr:MAG: hypothetical protein IPK69_01695 [Phycisphaerales bacterium]